MAEVADAADAAVALTCELISIDSVNPGLVPSAAGERAIVALMRDRLERSGFRTIVLGPADRPSVIAVYDPGAGRTVVLNGHLDTVGVEGMSEPFTPRIEGDRLIGRGACDMKAGVAGMVVAAEALAERNVAGRIVLALVADEEDASIGTEAVIQRLAQEGIHPDVAVVGEPSWMNVAVAHRGFAVFTLRFRGRAAHSSQPEQGVDAVAMLGTAIVAIGEANAALGSAAAHRYLGHGSFAVTVVSGGTAPFTIAASAEATVEKRTLPGESAHSVQAELEQILADAGISAELELVIARDAWEVVEHSTASELKRLLQAKRAAEEVGAPYWMESALWDAAGVPSLVFGPAGGGMHAIDEWVELDQLRAYPGILIEAIDAFLAVPA